MNYSIYLALKGELWGEFREPLVEKLQLYSESTFTLASSWVGLPPRMPFFFATLRPQEPGHPHLQYCPVGYGTLTFENLNGQYQVCR